MQGTTVVDAPKPLAEDHAGCVPDVRVPRVRGQRVRPRPEPSFDQLQWNIDVLDVDRAHRVTEGAGVRVAVIDSGVYEDHPRLDHALDVDSSRNLTDDGRDHNPIGDAAHGTAVAGVIAASPAPLASLSGVAPEVDLLDYRVFSKGAARLSTILRALECAAAAGVDVVNLSVNRVPSTSTAEPGVAGVLGDAVRAVERNGGIVVAPIGNGGRNLSVDAAAGLPLASVPEVVTVGSVAPESGDGECAGGNRSLMPAEYTNYGAPAVDVAAPGGETGSARRNGILTTSIDFEFEFEVDESPNNDLDAQSPAYEWWEGSSFAAPHVAGTAALLASVDPDRPHRATKRVLRSYATGAPDPPHKYYGYGVIDAYLPIKNKHESS